MRLLRRLRYLIRLSSHDAELLDELAHHRELIERELIEGGMSPDAARAEARRRMGGGRETSMREHARAVWLWPSLESLWQDATYSLRDLRRHPTFTLGVILTLALGIGANAAMFGLVDRLLFRAPAMMIDPATVHRVYLYRRSSQGWLRARRHRDRRRCGAGRGDAHCSVAVPAIATRSGCVRARDCRSAGRGVRRKLSTRVTRPLGSIPRPRCRLIERASRVPRERLGAAPGPSPRLNRTSTNTF